MARTPYADPDGEKFYQDTVAQSSRPSIPMAHTRPEASLGGKSQIEVNNPEVGGPSDRELQDRNKEFERQRRRNRGD